MAEQYQNCLGLDVVSLVGILFKNYKKRIEERLSPGRCRYHKARPRQTDSGWPGARIPWGGTRERASCRYSFSFVQELSLLYCQWGQGIPCCWYRELIYAEGTNTKWTFSTLWSKQLSRWLQNPNSMLQGKIFLPVMDKSRDCSVLSFDIFWSFAESVWTWSMIIG